MQKILTPALLESLTRQGYRYCLLRTTSILGEDAERCVTLVPVADEPLPGELPDHFDRCIPFDLELRQMAAGIDDTIVLVDLGEMNHNMTLPLRKKRILILDDDIDILEILEVLLNDEGYEAIAVDRTDNLPDLVRYYRPSLLLLDFGLQGINGGEWCARLKRDPELVDIPVVIFTAYANKGLQIGSFGCNDFIAKPFDLDRLTSCIKSLTLLQATDSISIP